MCYSPKALEVQNHRSRCGAVAQQRDGLPLAPQNEPFQHDEEEVERERLWGSEQKKKQTLVVVDGLEERGFHC